MDEIMATKKQNTVIVYADKDHTIELGKFEYSGELDQPEYLIRVASEEHASSWVSLIATSNHGKDTLTLEIPKAIFVLTNSTLAEFKLAYKHLLKGCKISNIERLPAESEAKPISAALYFIVDISSDIRYENRLMIQDYSDDLKTSLGLVLSEETAYEFPLTEHMVTLIDQTKKMLVRLLRQGPSNKDFLEELEDYTDGADDLMQKLYDNLLVIEAVADNVTELFNRNFKIH